MKTVFLGDSITEGFQELKKHPNVVNMGVGGDRTTEVIERLVSVKDEDPDRLVMLIGINDVMNNHKIWFSDLPISIETTYRFILRYLVNHLTTKDITLLSVLPIRSMELISQDDEGKLNDEIDELNQFIRKISNEFGVNYLDINSHFKENNRLKREYTTDGVHLTPKGYQLLYEKTKIIFNSSA